MAKMFLLLHRNSFTNLLVFCFFLLHPLLLAYTSMKNPQLSELSKEIHTKQQWMGNLKDIERITKSCISSLISTSHTHTSNSYTFSSLFHRHPVHYCVDTIVQLLKVFLLRLSRKTTMMTKNEVNFILIILRTIARLKFTLKVLSS